MKGFVSPRVQRLSLIGLPSLKLGLLSGLITKPGLVVGPGMGAGIGQMGFGAGAGGMQNSFCFRLSYSQNYYYDYKIMHVIGMVKQPFFIATQVLYTITLATACLVVLILLLQCVVSCGNRAWMVYAPSIFSILLSLISCK